MKKGFFYNLFLVALIVLCAALIYSVAVENKNDDVTNPDLNGDVINPGGSLDQIEPGDGTVEEEPTDKAPVYGLNDLLCVYGTEPTIDGEKVIFTEPALLTCVNEEKPFELGWDISADICNYGTDVGVVFFVDDNGLDEYWESDGVSYCFLFISHDGYLYLGHVATIETGTWYEVRKVAIDNYNPTQSYNVKACTYKIDHLRYGIDLFLDGVRMCSVQMNYSMFPINGTGWGVRSAGGDRTTISNLKIVE